DFAALIRIKINVSRVTIHRQRDELFRQGAVSIGERGRLTRNGWCRANRSVSGGSCGRQSTACCARSGWIPGRRKTVLLDADHCRVAPWANHRTVTLSVVVLP